MAILSSTSKRAALAGKIAASVGASLLSASAVGADLTVQIGAFGTTPKAQFTEQAKTQGEVSVVRGDDGITRVSIGRYATRSDARDALARLQTSGYRDAYIAALPTQEPTQKAEMPVAQQKPTPEPSQRPPRTLTNPANKTASVSSQRLPSGGQLVAPKRPDTSGVAAQAAKESGSSRAGRFRLRTHDTVSGKTTDLVVPDNKSSKIAAGTPISEIPLRLRDKLVYLDGVPHIKEGDRFIPLDNAVEGQP